MHMRRVDIVFFAMSLKKYVFCRDEACAINCPVISIEDVPSIEDTATTLKSAYRFKKPSTDKELDQLSGKHFSLNTDRKISWATELFKDWKDECMKDPECPTKILWCNLNDSDLNKAHLCRTLCSFVNEV